MLLWLPSDMDDSLARRAYERRPSTSSRRVAADETDAPPRLGERLAAAYAVRAGAELRRTEGLTELVVALG